MQLKNKRNEEQMIERSSTHIVITQQAKKEKEKIKINATENENREKKM